MNFIQFHLMGLLMKLIIFSTFEKQISKLIKIRNTYYLMHFIRAIELKKKYTAKLL